MNRVLLVLMVIVSLGYAKVNVVVSILPQVTFVKKIGGDKVNIALMVKPGNSPHAYEPKASQMKDISKASVYMAMGVEFEKVWLERFASQNSAMKIVDLTKGITKLAMQKHGHDHHEHDDEEGLDPHIWTAPDNLKTVAKNIYQTLVAQDRANEAYYKVNYESFMAEIETINKEIQTLLKDTPKGAKFMVFHPAWGYFANQYGLVQLPIEVEGKNPKPKMVAKLIAKAKQEQIRAIFTAPEFSDSVAKSIADELGIAVIKVSPLNPKWGENLLNLAKAIAK